MFEIIEHHRPSLFFSVPSNYVKLLACPAPDEREYDLSSVRHSNTPGAVWPGSSGKIIPGFEARIVDDNNQPVAQGETGNLLVKADSACASYWNQHEKTKDTIEGHWIRTGDKYYQDESGYFWHAGRTDDMLKVSGVWVSPIEIERILSEHPAVLEAAVVFRKDADELIKPVACIVPRDGTRGSPGARQRTAESCAEPLACVQAAPWHRVFHRGSKDSYGKGATLQAPRVDERMFSEAFSLSIRLEL